MVWATVEYLPCTPWLRRNAPHHHSTAAFGAQDEGKAARTPIGARRAPWWRHGVDPQGGGGLEFGQRDRQRREEVKEGELEDMKRTGGPLCLFARPKPGSRAAHVRSIHVTSAKTLIR